MPPAECVEKSQIKQAVKNQRKFSGLAETTVDEVLVEETGYSSADIANYLGISESNVFHAVKRGKKFLDQSSGKDESK